MGSYVIDAWACTVQMTGIKFLEQYGTQVVGTSVGHTSLFC